MEITYKPKNIKTMKTTKILWLAAIMVMPTVAEAESIQFEDAMVKQLCVENWDEDGDGELSTDEAMQVKSLGSVFEGMAITRFEELQYFTALRTLDDWAFAQCTSLEKVTLPADLREVGEACFYHCTALTAIEIPAGVKTVGKAAFKACGGLTNLTVPANVLEIGDRAFQYCIGLEEVNFEQGVSRIGERAFGDCYALQFLKLPQSVSAVGAFAFENSGIITVKLPGGLKITPYMLARMYNMTSVSLPFDTETIAEGAFYGCEKLGSIYLPPYVKSIGSKAFAKCNSMRWVYSNPTTPPDLAQDAFIRSEDGRYVPRLYILENAEPAYLQDLLWSQFKSIEYFMAIQMSKEVSTFTSEFDADFSVNEDLQVYAAARCKGNVVMLEEVKDKYVPAHTGEDANGFSGVIIKGKAGKEYVYKMGNNQKSNTPELLGKQNYLVGNPNDWRIEPEEDEHTNYVLNDGSFKTFDHAGIIKAGKAYLSLPDNADADGQPLGAKLGIAIEGNPTDVTFIIHESTDGEDKYYTLDGVEVSQPLGSGIYLHQGKKYMAKP